MKGLGQAGYVVYLPHYYIAAAERDLDAQDHIGAFENLRKARNLAEEHGMPLFAVDAGLIEVRAYVNQGDTVRAEEIISGLEQRINDLGYLVRSAEVALLRAEIAVLERHPNTILTQVATY